MCRAEPGRPARLRIRYFNSDGDFPTGLRSRSFAPEANARASETPMFLILRLPFGGLGGK
jgi:hypothetical protein